jgi:hypothetical protein
VAGGKGAVPIVAGAFSGSSRTRRRHWRMESSATAQNAYHAEISSSLYGQSSHSMPAARAASDGICRIVTNRVAVRRAGHDPGNRVHRYQQVIQSGSELVQRR